MKYGIRYCELTHGIIIIQENKKNYGVFTMRKINLLTKASVLCISMCAGVAVLCAGCSGKDEEETTTAVQQTTEAGETTAEADITTENIETTVPETEEATTVAKTMPAMKELYKEIVKRAGIEGMYQLYEEDLLDYYGINVASDCKDYVFYQSEVSPGIDTVALFQCNDKAGTARVAEGLETVLQSMKDSTVDYAPEEYAKAEKAKVKTDGTFVYLIICSDIAGAEDVINQY